MDSRSDNPTSISLLNIVPVVGIDHAPTTAFATEAYTLSPGPPISVPVPKRFGSASSRGSETLPTHISSVTLSSLSPSLPDAIMQVSTESERSFSRKKLLGAEHPDTLISMANLASTYSSQGKWNEAEQLEQSWI